MFKRALPLLVLAACGVSELEEQHDDGVPAASSYALTVTATDAAAMVAFVNLPGTTVAMLDDELGLDARAAQNIVARRPYATLAQLDLVPFVGDSALAKLRAWTRSHPVAPGEDVEGVAFSAEQAAAVVWGVNQATTAELDLEVGLDARAAANLTSRAPYASVTQLGAVSYVGSTALQALKAFAPVWAAKRAKPAFPPPPHATGSGTIAKDDQCPNTAACQPGLMCAGETIYGFGFCRPQWMAGTFVSRTPIAIPDGDEFGVVSSIEVAGLATVPEDVIVHLDIDHPRKADLRIVLTQPSSAEGTIWRVDSNGDARVVARDGIERDSSVNGTWTLKVVDTRTGEAGTLNGWALDLTSRYD